MGDYVAFYQRTVQVFKEAGVSNAVFILDFAANCHFDPDICDLIPSLYPGDGIVKWLFFNMFQTMDRYRYERAAKRGNSKADWQSRNQLDFWYNFLAEKKEFQSIPWGVGAWGTRFETLSKNPKPLNFTDRETFINQVQQAIESATYPKLKAFIYYDSLSSIITPFNITITQMSDIASGSREISYPTSSAIEGACSEIADPLVHLNVGCGWPSLHILTDVNLYAQTL